MKKAILTTLFGIFTFVYFLVLTIQSFYYENDGYGKTIEMDQDLLVKTFAGLVILICGIVVILKTKDHKDTFSVYNTSINLVGLLMCIYPLGMMFRAMNKHKSGSVIVDYLIWALFGAFILAYGIISYIEHKKKA
ncbi:MAG: hypothetical protein J6Y28_09240 [Acholeplasmatales bacterium]|nr:hypothetical protein [Acholeplasmatales bacterium]